MGWLTSPQEMFRLDGLHNFIFVKIVFFFLLKGYKSLMMLYIVVSGAPARFHYKLELEQNLVRHGERTPRPRGDIPARSLHLGDAIYTSPGVQVIVQAVDGKKGKNGHFDIQAFLFLISVRFSVPNKILVTHSVKIVCNFYYLIKTERFWHFFGIFTLARFWFVLAKNCLYENCLLLNLLQKQTLTKFLTLIVYLQMTAS